MWYRCSLRTRYASRPTARRRGMPSVVDGLLPAVQDRGRGVITHCRCALREHAKLKGLLGGEGGFDLVVVATS